MSFPESAAAQFIPCKVCRSPAPLFGAADFNKSCEERRGVRLPHYGFAVYYRRCPSCGFLFTDCFDRWSHAEFRQHIYNSAYVQVDPDYKEKRPLEAATLIAGLFEARKTTLSVLDYGGGSGLFAERLRMSGFSDCNTYDPFTPGFDKPPDKTYGLITCFETLEHTPDPTACVQAIGESLRPDGLVVFSTLVQPPEFEKLGINWWYVAPRNGHISIHSAKSLALLWEAQGFALTSVSGDVHIARRKSVAGQMPAGFAAA
ncbi:MAG TPA: class I SAM-dependent methyltransferase [Pseudolabrys sp.]|jgi:2-polyprenyl-6-hydroxyphenyl methylase/3-demethylubiquinone-9 3-methyltransferase|nr:class I SAM-dependent methyltransferase [Pseudolabrys sp.]